MENYGLIIRHLRHLAGLTVQLAAKKLDRSAGWLSAIENNTGACRLTESEFDSIVERLDGAKHRAMFKTWTANYKNRERAEKTFDGAALKYIRIKKELSLAAAKKLTGLSISYISEIENGIKPVSLEMRNQIMVAYGYSPSSFKNLSKDPVRSKAVPTLYKLEILLNRLRSEQIEAVFQHAQTLIKQE